jgi:hypothetical protein
LRSVLFFVLFGSMLFHFHSINGSMVVELGFEDFHLESRTSSFVLFTSQGPSGIQRRSRAGTAPRSFRSMGRS